MPRSRPSSATTVLVAALSAAATFGVLAPVAQRAQAATVRTSAAVPGTTSLILAATASGSTEVVDGRFAAAARPAPTPTRSLATGAVSAAAGRPAATDRADRSTVTVVRERLAAATERRAERRAAQRDRWVMPIYAFTWSAGYGEPGSMWSSGYHTGQDWTTDYGTPVYADHAGRVSTEWSDAYGNKLVISHPDGSQAWYGHLDGYARSSGWVHAGQLVGYVGCTGNCYGPHLHFEIHLPDGSDTDPVVWLRQHGVAL